MTRMELRRLGERIDKLELEIGWLYVAAKNIDLLEIEAARRAQPIDACLRRAENLRAGRA